MSPRLLPPRVRIAQAMTAQAMFAPPPLPPLARDKDYSLPTFAGQIRGFQEAERALPLTREVRVTEDYNQIPGTLAGVAMMLDALFPRYERRSVERPSPMYPGRIVLPVDRCLRCKARIQDVEKVILRAVADDVLDWQHEACPTCPSEGV